MRGAYANMWGRGGAAVVISNQREVQLRKDPHNIRAPTVYSLINKPYHFVGTTSY